MKRVEAIHLFKATDPKTRRDVVVKVHFIEFEIDPGFYSRFQREEDSSQLQNHSHILKFIPNEEADYYSQPDIVTEYLSGYTLAHLLSSMRPMPEKDALRLAGRICELLAYMHNNGATYSALRPQNILICDDGSLRIIDFGVAKAAEGRRITFARFAPTIGTPDCMAPEQIKGKRGDERTDIYRLGAMLYEMVVGVSPFEEDNLFLVMNARVIGDPVAPRKRNPNVSPQVAEIILHAMERDPGRRYQKVAAMKTELDHPLATVQLTGRCDRLQSPALWPAGGKKVRWIVLSVAATLLIFGLLLWQIIKRGLTH